MDYKKFKKLMHEIGDILDKEVIKIELNKQGEKFEDDKCDKIVKDDNPNRYSKEYKKIINELFEAHNKLCKSFYEDGV